jgi:hypothetical protein
VPAPAPWRPHGDAAGAWRCAVGLASLGADGVAGFGAAPGSPWTVAERAGRSIQGGHPVRPGYRHVVARPVSTGGKQQTFIDAVFREVFRAAWPGARARPLLERLVRAGGACGSGGRCPHRALLHFGWMSARKTPDVVCRQDRQHRRERHHVRKPCFHGGPGRLSCAALARGPALCAALKSNREFTCDDSHLRRCD